MRIPTDFRPIAIATLALSLAAGCSRTDVNRPPPAPQLMQPIAPLFQEPWIPPSDDWVVVADPGTIVDIESLDGINLLGYDDFDDYLVALVDADGVTQQDLMDAGAFVVLPNLEVQITVDSGSLVIGFVDGYFEEGGTTAWQNLQLPAVHAIATGEGARVGVVDTGAYYQHPILIDNVVILQGTRLPQTEEPPNGENDDPEYDDHIDEGYGHGTFVSGEVVIMAPDAEFLPLRALNHEGNGSILDIISAMYLCRDNACDMINLSMSFTGYHEEFEKILQQFQAEGILVVAAGGNAGPSVTLFPASSLYCVGVAAINEHYTFPPFSATGPLVDVAAPGWRVTSAAITTSSQGPQQRAFASGTSMAAPIVCGSVAVLMEEFALSPLSAYGHLKVHTHATDPVDGTVFGAVDPLQALQEQPGGGI